MITKDNSPLVYSTDIGRICSKCQQPISQCKCKTKKTKSPVSEEKIDGIVRIQRETKGRGGKTVTTISGFQNDTGKIKELASRLKNLCGTGGSIKGGIIVIQGDHRQAIKTELERQGYHAKLAGG